MLESVGAMKQTGLGAMQLVAAGDFPVGQP